MNNSNQARMIPAASSTSENPVKKKKAKEADDADEFASKSSRHDSHHTWASRDSLNDIN